MRGIFEKLTLVFFNKTHFHFPDPLETLHNPLEKLPRKDVLTKVNEFESYIMKSSEK
jgi:hypothetical protein